MQTTIQSTRQHLLRLNILRPTSKPPSLQLTNHDYVIISWKKNFSMTTAMTSPKRNSSPEIERVSDYTNLTSLSVKPFSKIPGPRAISHIPYSGIISRIKPFGKHNRGNLDKILMDMQNCYGPIFKIQMNCPTVIVTDLKDISTVVRNQGKYPFRPNFEIYNVYCKRMKVKPNVSANQGEEWWKLREPMQKIALHPKNISRYLPLMGSVVDDFVKLLLSGYLKNRNMDKVFQAFTAESSGTIFFNKRFGLFDKSPSEESKAILQVTYDIFDVLFKTLFGGSFAYKFYRNKAYIQFESAQNMIHHIIFTHVLKAREELKRLGSDNVEDSIVMSLLKDDLSNEDISLILEALYFGSIDSSAAGIQAALYALASNPDVQEKVRNDIFDAFCDNFNDHNNANSNKKDKSHYRDFTNFIPEHISKDALNKMHYLRAFVKEVHRMFPLLPVGTHRILSVDVVLGGYNVPAGVPIYTFHKQSCYDEMVFENPLELKPERWLRPSRVTKGSINQSTTFDHQNGLDSVSRNNETHLNEKSKRNWAVVPFGLGTRSCPGKRIFEHELDLLIVKLLTKSTIGLEAGFGKVDFEYIPFLKATKSIPFTFTPFDKNCN